MGYAATLLQLQYTPTNIQAVTARITRVLGDGACTRLCLFSLFTYFGISRVVGWVGGLGGGLITVSLPQTVACKLPC